jgi:hypothetical protein
MGIFRKLIKSNDNYGHKIGLNFNKNGQEFKTVVGGFITLVVKIFIIGYTIFKSFGMFTHKYNTYSSQEKTRVQSELEQEYNFKDINA